MFLDLDFSLKILIATYAPELIQVCEELNAIKDRIVCPFHIDSIIYVNKPCKICCFVRRLKTKEIDKIKKSSIVLKRRRIT